MPLVPIEIPPGAYRNGTEYQSKGNWRDVDLVRWHEGAMQPNRGWSVYSNFADDTITTFTEESGLGTTDGAIGCMAWKDNSGNNYLVWGHQQGATWVMENDGTITEIAPAGVVTVSHWVSFDTFGELPLMCLEADGSIYEWDLNTANNFTAVTNAPTDVVSIVVADERFIFALKEREVAWCDRDDRTVWTAAATNQAGSFPLDTQGELLFGLQMRGEVLIVGTNDCWRARYVGYPDVWDFRRIGATSALGGNAGVRVDDRAFWWGLDSFYVYQGGYVSKLPCDVWDFVLGDVNQSFYGDDQRRTFGWHNAAYNEVVWQYLSAGSAVAGCDSYVAYNYVENHWTYGTSPFTAVAERGAFQYALGVTNADLNFEGMFTTFSGTETWTLGTNWFVGAGTVSPNVLAQTSPAASSATYSLSAVTADSPYVVVFEIEQRTAGSLTVTFGESTSAISTNGILRFYLTTDSAPETIEFAADGTWDGEIDFLYIYRVPVFELDDESYDYPYTGVTPYAETGPLEIGDGQKRVQVTRILPDEQDAGELQYTFKTREYPTATETTHTAVTAANPTSVRFSGRQFKMRVEPATANTDWRHGETRLEITAAGER